MKSADVTMSRSISVKLSSPWVRIAERPLGKNEKNSLCGTVSFCPSAKVSVKGMKGLVS